MNKTQGFETYNLSKEILQALEILKYKVPTKIQEKVIPAALAERDVIAKSGTGSGKTAAFGIPLCEKVKWEYNEPQVLVLEPTRELTVQVKEELSQIGRKKKIKVPDLFGGFPIDKQIQTLRQKSHIVVGTPGRVHDHIRRGSLKIDRIETVVIDEADLMLDMGFVQEVEEILSTIKNRRITMLFSATLGEEIQGLASRYMDNPLHIEISIPKEQEGAITQKLYQVENDEKYPLFLDLLAKENPESAIIFCGTKEMVNVLYRKLRKDGVICGMIHGDMDQQDRISTINAFRIGKFRYIIATDVIARGIDFENLSHVMNYDFPTGRETYVHRIGRTGRNGAKGVALSLVASEDERMKGYVEKLLAYELPYTPFIKPTDQEKKIFWDRQKERPKIRKKKGAGFAKEITKLSIGGGRKSKMRSVDIVGTICNIQGVNSEDIGIIDIRESITYVEIFNGKGKLVLEALQNKPVKGKIRKVRVARSF